MFGLDEKNIEMIKKILNKNKKIRKKVIFGSRATGKYRGNSEIDIAVYGELSLRDIINLLGEFDESDLIYKVDLVCYETLENEELKTNIDEDGIEF